MTLISGASDFLSAGFRLARVALGLAAGGASESPPERTRRFVRVVLGTAVDEGPAGVVIVILRDFRRDVCGTSSSNSSSRSSFTAEGGASSSEPEDSMIFRREAAARREGRAGVIVDIESTELNWRFVVGDFLGGLLG